MHDAWNRWTRFFVALLLSLVVALVGACGGDDGEGTAGGDAEQTQPEEDESPTPTKKADGKEEDKEGSNGKAKATKGAKDPSLVTGLVLSVEQKGDTVSSFVLRDEKTGKRYEILIDPKIKYGFDLHHLVDHQEGKLPVSVKIEKRGDEFYAKFIVDA